MIIPKPLILFIDAYDSFSNNIISILETSLNASVRTIRIDNPALASDVALHAELRHYAAVVCGPGPGHPGKEEDVGIMRRIWRLSDEEMLPVLGICLGFQGLCLEFGGVVKRLKGPQHGMIRQVNHAGESYVAGQDSIFSGVGEIGATLYQSLCADIGHDSDSEELGKGKRYPSERCPNLQPLAWVESDLSVENDCGVMDNRVLVAVQHRTKPFWGLQYHPESICTDSESTKVIKNWFKLAQRWNIACRQRQINAESPIEGQFTTQPSLLRQFEQRSIPGISIPRTLRTIPWDERLRDMQDGSKLSRNMRRNLLFHSRTINLPEHFSIPEIVEAIQDVRDDQIILESSNAYETSIGSADVRGRYSIIGLDISEAPRFEYTIGSDHLTIIHSHMQGMPGGEVKTNIDLRPCSGIWPFLAKYLDRNHLLDGNKDSPFWGGFMGYTTYELGLEGIDVEPQGRHKRNASRPDLCFAWVNRSLVIDHRRNLIYIQALAKRGSENKTAVWMDSVAQNLETASHSKACSAKPTSLNTNVFKHTVKSINPPNDTEYESKVRRCQEYIRSGDAYELCLTDQTSVIRLKNDIHCEKSSLQQKLYQEALQPSLTPNAWSLYKTLRKRQPAPFASYVRLGTATLVSSSPERFLKWDEEGKCELRPMKGTVRKSPTVSTLAQASALLDVPKEKAENLMIVDLVRHDLHGVCGSGNVTVPRLMVVEEYASVFQMVSIVQGQIPVAVDKDMEEHLDEEEVAKARRTRYTGMDVLAASLPPGSMTGAPKKRSCEILQEIEGGKDRSLYSGVVGYMDVVGRGDWSVTIRSMFKWGDEDEVDVDGQQTETWHIGAGGAVTTLSTAEGEREEMQTKLNGTLGIFR
jgi:para-aminobenzoate synthetase